MHLLKPFVYIIIGIIIFNSCEDKDTTPPNVSISSPANGATVSDTITIKALVADGEEYGMFYVRYIKVCSLNIKPIDFWSIYSLTENHNREIRCIFFNLDEPN